MEGRGRWANRERQLRRNVEIAAAYAGGESCRRIAPRFGLSPNHVASIVKRLGVCRLDDVRVPR